MSQFFAPDLLSYRVVMVTGASRGIGAGIALACAQLGARVIVGFESAAGAGDTLDRIEEVGGTALALQADVTQPDQVGEMVDTALQRWGQIDALVNNAGIMPESSISEMTLEEWRRVVDVNLTGAFVCTQAVLPSMLERGHGSVVMVSSRLGQIGFPGLAHYSASKAGLLGLTKALAREVGPQGVRVNAVAPGVTLTEMGATVTEGEVGRRRLAELPAGRFAEVEEVAATVVFLLSEAASLYHGQTLCPNGGGYMP